MLEWLRNNFNNIAAWSSIIGLAVSLWVLYSIRKLRTHYTSKARIPELIKQLEEYSSQLNTLLNDVEKNKQIILTISKRLEFTLNSIQKKSSRNIYTAIRKLNSRINNLRSNRGSIISIFSRVTWNFENEVWDLYTDLQGILQGLKESSKDSEWN